MHKQMKDLLLTLTLTNGQVRMACPVCRAKEKSLVVTIQDGHAKWICHRASCQQAGQHSVGTQLTSRKQEKPYYKHTERQVPPPPMALYQPRQVKDNQGNSRGFVYRRRTSTDKSYPKDLNQIDSDWCKLHFPSPINSNAVILVEDIISANKMNPHFPCVALLGVHLSEAKLDYLLTQGISHVIIALDNDATRQAIRIARRFCISTSILPLLVDLKDDTEEHLEEIAIMLRNKYNVK